MESEKTSKERKKNNFVNLKSRVVSYLKLLTLIGLVLACWLVIIPVTQAATCQEIAAEQVCIQKIKRSAKYYWEYRVNLSINAVKQAVRVYNCRDRYYLLPDRTQRSYQQSDRLGKMVCRLYRSSV
jgi:hypothetical protein